MQRYKRPAPKSAERLILQIQVSFPKELKGCFKEKKKGEKMIAHKEESGRHN